MRPGVEARARYLAREYAELAADAPALTERLNGLRAIAGHETVDGWLVMLGQGRLTGLVRSADPAALRTPAYGRLRRADEGGLVARLALETLEPEALREAAGRILGHMT